MRGEIDITVYYEDTDALGVVYYANYLKYFERGRSELLATATGRSIATINADGYNIAVYRADITFKKPARLSDRCRVVTDILAKGSPYRLHIGQELYRDDELLTAGEIQLVCLDDRFNLREFPTEILATRGS
ncbi:thioesterase family protein [Haliangium sp.]|uniref:thioesterase family protein n=1 Tax=Haliangium sp. TaxID=2663208 RepID=UPI003D10FF5F